MVAHHTLNGSKAGHLFQDPGAPKTPWLQGCLGPGLFYSGYHEKTKTQRKLALRTCEVL